MPTKKFARPDPAPHLSDTRARWTGLTKVAGFIPPRKELAKRGYHAGEKWRTSHRKGEYSKKATKDVTDVITNALRW
jgi:hypothetical protein